MPTTDNCVTIHPYFRVQEGKLDEFKALCERFIAKSQTEPLCLYYGFSFNGNDVFCREGYIGAEGVFAHLEDVGPELAEAMTISELFRLELHGPESELAKMREPLAGYNPTWYALECGFRK